MARPNQKPISELLRIKDDGPNDESGLKRKKNDFREMKELEEQRKAGTAPAMVDVETGRDINPHIPEFIEKTPWYVATDGPTLKHQRPHPDKQKSFTSVANWYKKGTTGKVAFKFRKGACENCGAMGHQKKDCFDRPRKLGAKFTEEDFAPDDYVQPNLSLSYDAKRDRWNGYDSATYLETVVKEHEEMEELSKVIKAEKIKKGEIAEDEDEEDGVRYADHAAPSQTVDMDSRTRITVRNLRIREDPAKYLYNLNENGPYYDPKSRSMRENPFLGVPGKEAEAAKFAGENYTRYTGEVMDANQAMVFAWQARSKGVEVHAIAEPTKLEFLQKNFATEKAALKEQHKKTLLEKYGGEEYLDAPAQELLLAQTEAYVEYNRKGKIIKGEQRPTMKSKYEEDRMINNHTTVFGSYWKDGQWGYKCCHSLVKKSYCIGKKGIQLENQEFTRMPSANSAQVQQLVPKKPEVENNEKDENELPIPKDDEVVESSDELSIEEDEADENEDGEEEIIEEEMDEERKKELERELELEKERREKKEKKREAKREKRKRQKERSKEKSKDKKKKRRKSETVSSSSSDSEEEENEKSTELRKAIKRARTELKQGKLQQEMSDRDRAYHSNYETKALTEAEIEAYNLVRIRSADPMASYMHEKINKK